MQSDDETTRDVVPPTTPVKQEPAAVRTSPLASLWSFVAGAVAGTRSSDTADRLAPRVPWKGMVPPEPLSAGPGDGERCKK